MKREKQHALDDLIDETVRYIALMNDGTASPVCGHPNKTIVQYLRTSR